MLHPMESYIFLYIGTCTYFMRGALLHARLLGSSFFNTFVTARVSMEWRLLLQSLWWTDGWRWELVISSKVSIPPCKFVEQWCTCSERSRKKHLLRLLSSMHLTTDNLSSNKQSIHRYTKKQ